MDAASSSPKKYSFEGSRHERVSAWRREMWMKSLSVALFAALCSAPTVCQAQRRQEIASVSTILQFREAMELAEHVVLNAHLDLSVEPAQDDSAWLYTPNRLKSIRVRFIAVFAPDALSWAHVLYARPSIRIFRCIIICVQPAKGRVPMVRIFSYNERLCATYQPMLQSQGGLRLEVGFKPACSRLTTTGSPSCSRVQHYSLISLSCVVHHEICTSETVW